MRFALLGDHADGLNMARALVTTGRHELALYSGPGAGMEYLQRWGLKPPRVGDLEEVLADPRIEAIQMLKALNRSIYYSSAEVEPAFTRMKRWVMGTPTP